ncbi:MAG TPA: PRC-barrel domain-containing protein [Planctomycetota bacterium]|nr:PRC-barrel domain-containing protein [Planctomycetota bacterium]
MGDSAVQLHGGMLRLAKSIGARVVNSRDELLGRIEDVLVDLHDGHVAAFILSFREFAGWSDKLVAVPLAALTFDPKSMQFQMKVDRETLHNAPSFRSDDWPELIDRVWTADVYSYYGYPPYWHE